MATWNEITSLAQSVRVYMLWRCWLGVCLFKVKGWVSCKGKYLSWNKNLGSRIYTHRTGMSREKAW